MFGASPTTDRRAFLAAASGLAMLTAGPVLATAQPASEGAAWDAAMRAYVDAKSAWEAFRPSYNRVLEAYEATIPSMDGIHWQEFRYANRNHVARVMDLDKAWTSFLNDEGNLWWARDKESADRAKGRYRAALDSVQAYRDAETGQYRDSGMEAADHRLEELSEAVDAARLALMDMPAPDLVALRWKLDIVLELDSDDTMQPWSRKFVGQTIADYQRLLGGAA